METKRGPEAVKALSEYLETAVAEISMNGHIVELEFKVPEGDDAVSLQRAILELGRDKSEGVEHEIDSRQLFVLWGAKLMTNHGGLSTGARERVMRQLPLAKAFTLLADLSGLRAREDDLSSDRS